MLNGVAGRRRHLAAVRRIVGPVAGGVADGAVDQHLAVAAHAQLDGGVDAAAVEALDGAPDRVDALGVDAERARIDLGRRVDRGDRLRGPSEPGSASRRKATSGTAIAGRSAPVCVRGRSRPHGCAALFDNRASDVSERKKPLRSPREGEGFAMRRAIERLCRIQTGAGWLGLLLVAGLASERSIAARAAAACCVCEGLPAPASASTGFDHGRVRRTVRRASAARTCCSTASTSAPAAATARATCRPVRPASPRPRRRPCRSRRRRA